MVYLLAVDGPKEELSPLTPYLIIIYYEKDDIDVLMEEGD